MNFYWHVTLNKKILLPVVLLLVCGAAYWYWTRPEPISYQGGFPGEVKPKVIQSASVTINRQETLNTPAIVKTGAKVEFSVKLKMTSEYSDWIPIVYEFDFRPVVDGRVDWDAMWEVETHHNNPYPKSEWTVKLEPGEYEFRAHIWSNNKADITQPYECWMITQGKVTVEPK